MNRRERKPLPYRIALGVACCLMIALSACSPSALPASPKLAKAEDLMAGIKARPVSGKSMDDTFRKACLSFAAQLLQETAGAGRKTDNILLSPLSVLTALGMTASGAGGETLREMEGALLPESGLKTEDLARYLHEYYKKLPSSEKSRFSFANSIWFKDEADFKVEESFLQTNKDYYNPDIYVAPFDETTLRDINGWVDLKTEHMIPEVLDEISPDTMIALINALLFDAEWQQPFDSSSVRPDSFTAADGSERRVEMMTGEELLLINQGDTIGVMKPYAGDKYRFAAFLPREADTDFSRYVESLSGEKLLQLLDSVENRDFMFQIPKLNIEYRTDLIKALRGMGIEKAFDGEQADFSGISRTTHLSVSQVIHETRLELDNNGTKAAAVTVVMATKAAMPVPGQVDRVRLDRPFVYMIVDTENRLPIFLGTVTDIKP